MSNRRIIRRSGVLVCIVETLRQERWKDEKAPPLQSLDLIRQTRSAGQSTKTSTVCNSKAQLPRISLNLFGIWNKTQTGCYRAQPRFHPPRHLSSPSGASDESWSGSGGGVIFVIPSEARSPGFCSCVQKPRSPHLVRDHKSSKAPTTFPGAPLTCLSARCLSS